MEYNYLGRSALRVSPLCLGTMMFGGATDEAVAKRIVDSARGRGINFLDTADLYNGGACEEVVGRCIADSRHHWVVATKFGHRMTAEPNEGGQSRKWIFQDVEDSLRRLGTDFIDILYFHKSDGDAPFDEPLRAIRDLMAQGKVRYYGISNFKAWRIVEVCRIADQLGMDRPVVSQPLYNIVDPPCRGRAAARRRALRDRRRALQPARARGAVGQIRSGRGAAAGFARRAQ